MITNIITDYLDKENISKDNKILFLRECNLCYSDIFKLLDIYKGDANVHPLIMCFVDYDTNKLKQKIKSQDKKFYTAKKNSRKKHLRRKNYDKYKRK